VETKEMPLTEKERELEREKESYKMTGRVSFLSFRWKNVRARVKLSFLMINFFSQIRRAYINLKSYCMGKYTRRTNG
jgi:hypothetical protein